MKDGAGTKRLYKNGVLRESITYKNKKQIEKTVYYSNGVRKSKVNYYNTGRRKLYQKWGKDGKMDSYVKYYSNKKRSCERTYYSNGSVKKETSYYSNGRRKQVTTKRSSGSVSKKNKYSSKNKLTYSVSYNTNSKIINEYKQYYSNGRPKVKYSYSYNSYGVMIKKVTTMYDSNGKTTSKVDEYKSNDNLTTSNTGSLSSFFKVPVKNGVITCRYRCYSGHNGIDIGSVNGAQTVYASAPGQVIAAGTGCSAWGGYIGNACNSGQGNYLVLYHKINGRNYFTVYMHLSKQYVNVGQTVGYSTKIGQMGNSGNSSGMHLHFEVFEDTDKDQYRWDEYITNPENIVNFSGLKSRATLKEKGVQTEHDPGYSEDDGVILSEEFIEQVANEEIVEGDAIIYKE